MADTSTRVLPEARRTPLAPEGESKISKAALRRIPPPPPLKRTAAPPAPKPTRPTTQTARQPSPPADPSVIAAARSKKASRFLAYVLRHGPDTIGVTMDKNGWVDVDQLLERSLHHRPLTRETLTDIVATDRRRRFAFSEDGTRVRAVNGHSIDVDLGLSPTEPPATLYHGTAVYNLDAILTKGLLPRGRTHVHLGSDRQSAAEIGGTLTWPKILSVDTGAMAADGHLFYRSENGVWLCGPVAPSYLTLLDSVD